MRTCHIFCAAGFDGLLEPIGPEDLVLAADGGLRHTQALGITPDCILGDFDSLGYMPEGPAVNRFPVEKDDTDSMLAIRLGLKQGYDRFLIYGAMDGPRLDHTIANLQALAFLASHNARGVLVGLRDLASVLNPCTLRFPETASGIVSLFAPGSGVEDLTIRGLQYPLEDAPLRPDFPLGVSNHFQGRPSEISWKEGQLLLIWGRENGLPERSAE